MKNGYNWEYRIQSKTMGGEECSVIDEVLWFQYRDQGCEQIISGYPYGDGRREDSTVDEIKDAFNDLMADAREEEVVVHAGRGRSGCYWVVHAPVDSPLVRGLATQLSAINRVEVAIKDNDPGSADFR